MPRILIVEDDPQIARIMQVKLERNGYGVTVAADGGSGLWQVNTNRPDLVLLDVMMPVMDGYSLLRSIRSDPMTQALPVIMLTAQGHKSDMLDAVAAGANDYVVKPFSVSDVLARVQRIIGDP